MNLWYPEAIRHDGNPGKVYVGENRCLGVTFHSMAGWVATALQMVESASPRVSWPFSIDLQGTVYQHYPLNALCWQAGSEQGNFDTLGIEHEGIWGVIEGPQLAASIRLVQWLAGECNWTDGLDGRLFEHNHWSSTQCPNGRIPLDRYVLVNAPVPPQQIKEESVPFTNDAGKERELDQGERITFLNKYAADIAAGSDTRVYVDESDPYNLRIRIVTEREQ